MWLAGWADLPLRAKGLVVVVAPVLALIAAVGAAVLVSRHEQSVQIATHAEVNVSNEASAVLTSLLDAETGARGYAATRKTVFLAPWQLANSTIGPQLQELQQSHTTQTAVTHKLVPLARHEIVLLRRLVATSAGAKAVDPALLAGKSVMDRVRGLVGDITAHTQALLAKRRAQIHRLGDTVVVLAVSGLVIGLLGVLALYLLLGRVTKRIDRARADAFRIGLGDTLPERATSADELGRLDAQLQQASRVLALRATDVVRSHDATTSGARARNDIVAHVLHELRTPLTAILGFAELLQGSDRLAERDAASVAQLVRGARHMKAITDEVADTAQEDAIRLDLADVDVDPLADEVCTLLAPLAAERRVMLDHAGCAGTAVRADRQRLAQVLINLVSNAIKYNRTPGRVSVSCAVADAGRVRIAVADTGRGIAAQDLARVFAPYERLAAAGGEVQGSGIGLALSRSYVEAMGGAIGVQSNEGQGSTFWVDLADAPGSLTLAGAAAV